jgi:hypothetical protein
MSTLDITLTSDPISRVTLASCLSAYLPISAILPYLAQMVGTRSTDFDQT